MSNSIIYALDFDGVICDSAIETAITGWKAARTLWPDMPATAPQVLIERFRLVRPIIETGYESILAMRLLYLNESIETIQNNAPGKMAALMQEASISVDDLKRLFGDTRDAWIAENLTEWLNMNPLYEGMAEKLRELGQNHIWYVITTKQERFVKQILQAHTIELADQRIYGLDRNMSKVEVLKGLLLSHPGTTLYFAEDRLPTLINVLKIHELNEIKLIFALWGYNTEEDKATAAQQAFLCQNLHNFLSQ